MAAKVRLPNKTNREHENGLDALVKDGHLFIFDGRPASAPSVVAIYAPGTWLTVEVGQAKS